MICSEARLAANRLNGAKSKGPVTTDGKSRSRLNGLKHGLTGEGIVVPEGDAEAIELRVAALEADLAPKSPVGALMIRKLAVLSVRSERAAEQELAAIARNVRHAPDDFDEARVDEADRLFEALGEDPRKNLRKLKGSPEGVDRLIEAWGDLLVDLAHRAGATWSLAHSETVAHLSGKTSGRGWASEIGALALAVCGDFSGLGSSEGGDLDDEGRRSWARARLFEAIDAEIAELEAHRETLDFETIELDRLEAPKRALFDDSKQATLARRYESEAHRGFFKALKEFRQAEAEFEARAEAASKAAPAPSEQVAPEAKMGSSRETPPTPDRIPAWALAEVPMDDPTIVRASDGQPLSIGRPPQPPR
jgi:hypothetical protein